MKEKNTEQNGDDDEGHQRSLGPLCGSRVEAYGDLTYSKPHSSGGKIDIGEAFVDNERKNGRQHKSFHHTPPSHVPANDKISS
jgi:hypothetical protein